MFMVVMALTKNIYVEADDYEVDEDGDLVFLVADEDDEFESEDGMVEVARVVSGRWDAVAPVEDDEDEDEVCDCE